MHEKVLEYKTLEGLFNLSMPDFDSDVLGHPVFIITPDIILMKLCL